VYVTSPQSVYIDELGAS